MHEASKSDACSIDGPYTNAHTVRTKCTKSVLKIRRSWVGKTDVVAYRAHRAWNGEGRNGE